MLTIRAPPSTYAQSGVDRAGVVRALARLIAATRYRPPPSHGRPVGGPGHFAGFIRVGRETLALTTDTVGTKVLLAEQLGRWEEVGEDVVAINVNDLAAVGARPAALVDTVSCVRPDEPQFAGLGQGISRGLKTARCALIGGETAVVADLVRGTDLGGTALGFFPRGRLPVTGSRIRPGDVVLGVPSSGLHANGFTLVRKLVEAYSADLRNPRRGADRPLGEELLTPTRIYSGVADAVADRSEVHGFAHISGLGVRNLIRLHPRVRFRLDSWPPPPDLFRWIQSLGDISDREMFQTFNMGIGFAIIAAPRRLPDLMRKVARSGGRGVRVIGRIERGRGVELPDLNLGYDEY